MKALILNSGIGKRMGELTSESPKCMTVIEGNETILSRQLRMLADSGIRDFVITTGIFQEKLQAYVKELNLPIQVVFVHNPRYAESNYIYSIYCAKKYLEDDDILLLHGDLVFEGQVLDMALESQQSVMAVSSTCPIPDKDFKAVICNGRISKIGIEFFENVAAAQPLYKLNREDWRIWLDKISEYCENGIIGCYAENAFNDVAESCKILPLDIEGRLCNEIDTAEDLHRVRERVREIANRTVYMCFSTDVIHSGHISIIKKAARLGKLIIGVLSDNAVASYKYFPRIPYGERKAIIENIKHVHKVIEQTELSYTSVLSELKPTFVVHGDDWRNGVQKPVRDEVIRDLAEYGGILVEYPYASDEKYKMIEQNVRREIAMPDVRRGRLRKLLGMKATVSFIEAHSGITGLIAENSVVYQEGKSYQFDGMWVSSLCDSTAKGKPDIELVDMSSRLRTIDDIMDVTTKPIILDGDTGGLTEHFVYNVKTLERMGVSAVIIEDKVGLKKNSLFGVEAEQQQDDVENFCQKITAGKKAQKTKDFMIIARIESLILEKGMEDALNRAHSYVRAGADGIMIHSRKKEPDEIFEFAREFRKVNKETPLVVVPTTFNQVTEYEFQQAGINIIIYANQLTRSGFPAMQKTALTILKNHRAKEADALCMPIREILTLIPEEV